MRNFSRDDFSLASWISAFTVLIVATTGAYSAWTPQNRENAASLRGVSAVTSRIAWASGAKGTVLLTQNEGRNWKRLVIPGTEDLDFRDVEGVDTREAWLLASGPGGRSRVYRTTDVGNDWTLQLTNPDASGFFDAMARFGRRSGILLGDPVEGRFVIYTTADGQAWTRHQGPSALPGEGAFAASGTCLVARRDGQAWFGTGAGRVFHSTDLGLTWTVSQTPLRHEGKAAGVFSLAFRDSLHGIAVGGDYTKPRESIGNAAWSADGGITWHEPASHPAGYRSAVQYRSAREAIATGTSGSDVSHDGGKTWQPIEGAGYNALSFRGKSGWAVGPEGRIARWR